MDALDFFSALVGYSGRKIESELGKILFLLIQQLLYSLKLLFFLHSKNDNSYCEGLNLKCIPHVCVSNVWPQLLELIREALKLWEVGPC